VPGPRAASARCSQDDCAQREKFGFRRLTLFAADSNEGSKKLARAAGFREVSRQKLAARSDGVFEDLIGFELYIDDYREAARG